MEGRPDHSAAQLAEEYAKWAEDFPLLFLEDAFLSEDNGNGLTLTQPNSTQQVSDVPCV